MDLQEVKSKTINNNSNEKRKKKGMPEKQTCLFQINTLHVCFLDVSLYLKNQRQISFHPGDMNIKEYSNLILQEHFQVCLFKLIPSLFQSLLSIYIQKVKIRYQCSQGVLKITEYWNSVDKGHFQKYLDMSIPNK